MEGRMYMIGRRQKVSGQGVVAVAMTIICLVILLPCGAMAALLAYEPFDYPAGDVLDAENGGVGFNGGWFDVFAPNRPGRGHIAAASVDYPLLVTSGNHGQTDDRYSRMERNF